MKTQVATALLLLLITIGHALEQYEESVEIVQVGRRRRPINLQKYKYETSYEMLLLSQSWPQTSCWDLNKRWSDQSCSPCKMPNTTDSWTVHGLWPSNRHGKQPSFCDNTKKFNPNLLGNALRARLEQNWPTFKLHTKNVAFWSHEWQKHGTCTSDIESTNTQNKYFAKTLELLDAYNVGKILENANIVPGKSEYSVDDIISAIENTLGVKTYITCSMNTDTRKYYIEQIHLCFDKSFQLVDCDTTSRSNCNEKEIFYPVDLKPC